MREPNLKPAPPPIILICQICGRARWLVSYEKVVEEEGWFLDLRRDGKQVLIRCPQHISEWILKESMEGRTVPARTKAREGRSKPRPADAGREPIPASFRGADALLDGLRRKYEVRAKRHGGMWQARVAQWEPENPTMAQGEPSAVSDHQGDEEAQARS